MSHPLIGWKSFQPDQQNPPNESVAAAEPAKVMQEGPFWWPVVRDCQGHIPQPLPRLQADKRLQPGRWCHDGQNLVANPNTPPGFVEIAWSLHGDSLLRVVAGIPLELVKDQGPIQMIGSSTISAHLFMV